MAGQEIAESGQKTGTNSRDNLVRARPDSVWDVPVVPGGQNREGQSGTVGQAGQGQDSAGAASIPVPRDISRLFAIDPGTRESGWVLLDAGRVLDSGVAGNYDVLRWIQAGQGADMLAIEMIAGMGMTVGQETFDTIRWIGRFQQAWADPEAVRLVFRRTVKSFLCGNQRAKDPNIRQALLDIFPSTGGGATPQIGTKAKPGPLYGVSSHAWSALAVAITVAGNLRLKGVLPVMPQGELIA
jgi:hypothetical protein